MCMFSQVYIIKIGCILEQETCKALPGDGWQDVSILFDMKSRMSMKRLWANLCVSRDDKTIKLNLL